MIVRFFKFLALLWYADERGWPESVAAAHARLTVENARLREALRPFAAFCEKAERFVQARAEQGGSPILPSKDFRLDDFRRARTALDGDGK